MHSGSSVIRLNLKVLFVIIISLAIYVLTRTMSKNIASSMGSYSNNFEAKKRQPQSPNEARGALKDEIEQLQKELKGQTTIRYTLEKAIHCHPLSDNRTCKSFFQPQSAESLVKEIALLELEISYLEKYILSLYRKSFLKRLPPPPLSAVDRITSPEVAAKTNHSLESVIGDGSNVDISSNTLPAALRCDGAPASAALTDSGIYRSHSSLSHRSANCSFRASPPFDALDASHSLPLSMLERIHANAGPEASTYRVRETPNGISEEMIKCIATIYCHLRNEQQKSPIEPWPNNPTHYSEASDEFSGTFSSTVEIHIIITDSQRLNSVQDLLQNYRSFISKLAQVDPGKLRHDEKLAFWINVHNALVMHAYIVYGIPRRSLKRISLVLKAAYNIGGHTVSVETIQSCILGCRLPRPTPWLHSLFFTKTKIKPGDLKAFAVAHREPRLRFALCSGCQSDPAVRLYTAKKVFQELEMAKEEYIEMNVKLGREERLVAPKNVECFVKEMGGLSESGLGDISKSFREGKVWRNVDWIPHNFSFRFVLSSEIIR